MSSNSSRAEAKKISLFYLTMAECLFRRADCVPHSNIGESLRAIGRDYLAKAINVPEPKKVTAG